MKCLETRHPESRPVGYGMIGCRGYFIVQGVRQSLVPRIRPSTTGRIVSVDFPGISCLATFMWSLWDKRIRVLILTRMDTVAKKEAGAAPASLSSDLLAIPTLDHGAFSRLLADLQRLIE